MIEVADGQWSEGQVLYCYNPSGIQGLPLIIEFAPTEICMVNDIPYEFIIRDNVFEFCDRCYTSRDNLIQHIKSELQARIGELE